MIEKAFLVILEARERKKQGKPFCAPIIVHYAL